MQQTARAAPRMHITFLAAAILILMKQLQQIIHESRDSGHYAEFLRERIYGTITLLALVIGLLVEAQHISIRFAFVSIATTALGLWSASMFAEYISYRVVHDRYPPLQLLKRMIIVHRGILIAAIPDLIMIGVAALGVISLTTALRTSIVLAIVSMTITIVQSANTRHSTIITTLTSIGIQAVVAILIVQLKLLAH